MSQTERPPAANAQEDNGAETHTFGPARKLLIFRLILLAALVLIQIVAIVLTWLGGQFPPRLTTAIGLTALLWLLFQVGLFLWVILRFRATRYLVNGREIVRRIGWLVRSETRVPLDAVREVAVRPGLWRLGKLKLAYDHPAGRRTLTFKGVARAAEVQRRLADHHFSVASQGAKSINR